MSEPLKWVGTCRGQIIEYGLAEMDSGATAVNIAARVDEYWDAKDEKIWKDCREGNFETRGAIWIILKDGSLHQSKIDSLMKHTNWDGDIRSIVSGSWKPTPCSFVIQRDNRDASKFLVAFVNAFDREPGPPANVSIERAQELQTQYGSRLRALAGNVARNDVPPPEGKPSDPSLTPPEEIPPAKSLGEEIKDAQAAGPYDITGSDIPF